MRILVAIDSFKGSLTSLEAGQAVKDAVCELEPEAFVSIKPLADGGEGTVEAFSSALGCEEVSVVITGPLCLPLTAKYCILRDSNTAVIEMAAAAGLPLVPQANRNPLNTTTFGVGELIKDALTRGCRRFIIGIGGSATNDGGTGMLSALGFEFLDQNGAPIPLGAKGLMHLKEIRTENALPALRECIFNVACDVENPLCGERGCSAVFAAQKGATPEMIEQMDRHLENYAALTKNILPRSDMNFKGAGAAGGLGFAFLSFLGANLQSGIDIILDETKMEDEIKKADLVVTGEGRLDAQTVMGKAPIGIAKLAKKHGKKVIAFSGCVTEDAEICNMHGIDAFFPIIRGVTTLENALLRDNAYKNLKATAKQVFRLILG